MIRSLMRIVLRGATVFLVVTFATFALIYSNGTGIARGILGTNATDEQVAREVARLGLDQPLSVQYGKWFTGLLQGDLGSSFFTNQPVADILTIRVPVTLSLIVVSMIFTVVISVAIGVLAAVRGGWLDRVLQLFSIIGAAVPSFVVAIALVFAFAVAIRLFPATGWTPPAKGLGPWAVSITLPVLAILMGSAASGAAQFRGTVKDTLDRDFVRTLRSRGMSEKAIILRHVLRNAGGPGLTVMSLQLISLIGGVIVIEQVFSLPGIGVLGNTAVQQGDIPVVMGTVLVTVIIVLVANALSDFANAALNPKARTT